MGLSGRAHETRSSDDWTVHNEGVWELAIHVHSGAVLGRERVKYQRPSDRPFELPDDEAAAIAHQFLERAELVPLDETRRRPVTHLRSSGGEINGEAKETTVLDAGVVVGRRIKAVEVDGPGGAVLVNVVPEGDVVGFRSIWRPVTEALDEVRITGPDPALEQAKQIAESVRGDVEVTKATFGYFEQGLLELQLVLQPAYTLVYVVRDDEVAMKSALVVAASDTVFEPLIGPKRFGGRAQRERLQPSERQG